MKGKWSPGKIVAVVLGSIGASVVLLVTLYIGVFQFVKGYARVRNNINEARARQERSVRETERESARRSREEADPSRDEEDDGTFGYQDEYPDGDSNDYFDAYGDEEYYEFHNALREDLSYQIGFETYEEDLLDNVSVKISYPVMTGEETADSQNINHILQKEVDEIKTYAESVTESISDDESFVFEAESYVTYMDEDVLSVVYMEYGYLDGATYESYIISVNVDMESGLALTNSQLLNINDEFSIDFRKRCERQNGQVDSLSMFSDQDITYLLTDDTSLIIFYTPLGMEVGFNYYYGWVTVTYQDYRKYQSHF